MATSTRTTMDKLLLDVVDGEMSKAMNEEVKLLEIANKNKEPWTGRKKIFDVRMTLGGGVGPRSEAISGVASGLPDPGAPTHANGEIYAKRIYGVGELTHDLIESSRGDKAAFRDALAENMETILLRTKKLACTYGYGDGRGILATVDAASNGTALEQEVYPTKSLQVTVDSTRSFSEGDKVALWTSSAENSTVLANGGQSHTDGTLDSEAVYVHSIDSDTTLTLARTRDSGADATLATNNVIRLYLDAEAGTAITHNSPMGLRGMADDGTIVSTFEGISRTTYPKWKGNVLNASTMAEGTTLSRNHFYKAAHLIHRRAGSSPDVAIMDPSLMREFLAIFEPDTRFSSVSDTDPGYSGALKISIGDKVVPVFMDFDCPYGKIFMFPKADLDYHELTPLQLDDSNGGILKQPKPYGATGSGDIYYFYYRWKFNWGTKKPFNFAVIENLAYTRETA